MGVWICLLGEKGVSEGTGCGKELPVLVPENGPVSSVVSALQDPGDYRLFLIIVASGQASEPL